MGRLTPLYNIACAILSSKESLNFGHITTASIVFAGYFMWNIILLWKFGRTRNSSRKTLSCRLMFPLWFFVLSNFHSCLTFSVFSYSHRNTAFSHSKLTFSKCYFVIIIWKHGKCFLFYSIQHRLLFLPIGKVHFHDEKIMLTTHYLFLRSTIVFTKTSCCTRRVELQGKERRGVEIYRFWPKTQVWWQWNVLCGNRWQWRFWILQSITRWQWRCKTEL